MLYLIWPPRPVTIFEHDIGIATSFSGMVFSAFWKRALHNVVCTMVKMGNSAHRAGFDPHTSCHSGTSVLTITLPNLPDAMSISTRSCMRGSLPWPLLIQVIAIGYCLISQILLIGEDQCGLRPVFSS